MTTTKSVPATIRLVALREQYEQLKPEIDAAIASVVARSAFIGGAEVADFERWFAGYCGVRHAVGVASGTTAIELVLRAHRIGAGDEVAMPANTFIATAAAVVMTGARPVFVDVDERTSNLHPARLKSAIGPRTKAIIPVHLYGRPAPMREILEVAAGIPVIEDAAQAHGARYEDGVTGALATAGCFSFYPTKNLGAFGDGGLITTNDDALADRLKLLRDHGRTSQYEHALAGQTARLDTLQAAVLRVQANALEDWNARRRQVAAWYCELLPAGITCPDSEPRNQSVYHVFVVRVAARDAFRAHLEAHGVATGVHYPVPLHLQAAFRSLGHRAGDFPVTERLSQEIVSLPMHPFIERAQVQYIADLAAAFLQRPDAERQTPR
jgi:dTDP-4-amino-4,6-dideoxygalactose transaminase